MPPPAPSPASPLSHPALATIGFLGAGNMAGAIVRAIAARRLAPPESLIVLDIDATKTAALAAETGARVAESAEALLDASRTVVLATKPQDLPRALEALAPRVRPDHLLVSIAAGLPCARLEAILPAGARLVRVMPNTPAMVGEGVAGVAPGAAATAEDVAAVVALFGAVGIAAEVPESHLDAVTALSGSGPAYVFRFMELMQAAGEELGLAPELARDFTLRTFLGAARLAVESSDPPGELRRKVTSPGGTTAAALKVFEERGLEDTVRRAMTAARDRSLELSRG